MALLFTFRDSAITRKVNGYSALCGGTSENSTLRRTIEPAIIRYRGMMPPDGKEHLMSRKLLAIIVGLVLFPSESASAQIVTGFQYRRVSVSVFFGGQPTFGYGFYQPYPFFAPPPPVFFAPPPVFILPPPIVIQQAPIIIQQAAPVVVKREPDLPVNDVPMEFDRDQFLIIRPGNPIAPRVEAPPPIRPAQGADAGLPREPKLAIQPMPEANPIDEWKRQIALGTEAFVAKQYGRAVERWQQAIAVAPREGKSHFLLAQAYFALGKYRESVIAIESGLRLAPNWPLGRFDPSELYGNDRAPYLEQLKALQEAQRKQPDDPMLLFLLGYQEWFAGDRAKALEFFRQARQRTTQPELIDRFLLAGDGPIV